MSKRYAFWRTADGKRASEPSGRNAPVQILAEIGNRASIGPHGVSWQGSAIQQMQVGLKMAFTVADDQGVEVNPVDAWAIGYAAMLAECHRAGGGNPLQAGPFVAKADELAALFLKKPAQKYILLASISVNPFPAKSLDIAGCRIEPLNNRAGFPLPTTFATLPPHSLYRTHLEKTRYQWLAIHTSGRSINEAVQRATMSLDLLRALWTLIGTYGRWTISFGSGGPKPLAAVHTGPIYTLHHPDKTLVEADLYWREEDPRGDLALFAPAGGWDRLDKLRKRALKKMARWPYHAELIELLGRYIAALDQTNPDVACLQIWTLLEKITDTVGARYDETIRRSTCAFKDRLLNAELLDCIRIQRNRFVHSAKEAGQGDQSAYLTKSFLEPHLLALIENYYDVDSLVEYAGILGMPVDPKRLAEVKRWTATALRIHGKPSAKKP